VRYESSKQEPVETAEAIRRIFEAVERDELDARPGLVARLDGQLAPWKLVSAIDQSRAWMTPPVETGGSGLRVGYLYLGRTLDLRQAAARQVRCMRLRGTRLRCEVYIRRCGGGRP
jgi:hypothetical protein